MTVKLLICAEANSGKTTLTKNLAGALVISHDGKKYPFPVPHVMVPSFESTAELLDTIVQKIEAYNAKFGAYPDTIVFDSVSKIFETIHNNCNEKFKGFTIYSELDKEIVALTAFIENSLIASGMNVVLISHALYDAEAAKYSLVGKGQMGLAA
jgi:GTPase SAR1 family protein